MALNGIRTLDEQFFSELKADPALQGRCLFIEKHPYLDRGFTVNGFDPAWASKMRDVVGEDHTLLPVKVRDFEAEAQAQGFTPVAMTAEDAEKIARVEAWLSHLNDAPEVSINSTLPGTVNGFLPFQVQGFNTLKDEEAGWLEWSTGTGKTVGASGLTDLHRNVRESFSVGIWWVKSHNKKNTQRALDALSGIETVIVAGTPAKRAKLYAQVTEAMAHGERPVMILNYEQARTDHKILAEMLEGQDVFYAMDEAPTKLRNHKTQTWKAFCSLIYSSVDTKGNPTPDGEKRTKSFRAYVMSATPIENGPMDFFNVIRLISPTALGTYRDFNKNHVVWGSIMIPTRQGPKESRIITGYRDLDKIGIKVSHIVHSVDKTDPDIAAMFPKVHSEDLYVDMSDHQQKLYNKLASHYADLIRTFAEMQRQVALTPEELEELTKLRAVFTVLEMIVDDPALVLDSAEIWLATKGEKGSQVAQEFRLLVGDDSQFEDDGEETRVAKHEAIRDLVEGNTDKVIAFSSHSAPYQKRLSKWLTAWGIGHVVYNGSLTMNQKQAAEDKFKADPECKLFLSSDAGSDSINLEVADLALHINLPWKPSTFEQRENRLHRVTSKFGHVRVVTMTSETEPEAAKAEILAEKRALRSGTKVSSGAMARALREMN